MRKIIIATFILALFLIAACTATQKPENNETSTEKSYVSKDPGQCELISSNAGMVKKHSSMISDVDANLHRMSN